MPSVEFISHAPEETIEIGRKLAAQLTPPVLVFLSGELGAGKTTLTKGIVAALGGAREEDVTSPTFTLVHVFRNGSRDSRSIYHVDLYRVEGSRDLDTLGLQDAFSEPAVVIVEWPERFTLRNDWPRVNVSLEHLEGDSRRIVISGNGGPAQG